MTEAHIIAIEDGFAIIAQARADHVVIDRVRTVVAYKVDELTTDLVCCDIVTQDGAGATVRTIHEELPGFEIAMKALAALAGFDQEWRAAVTLPPFPSNRIILYRCVGLRE